MKKRYEFRKELDTQAIHKFDGLRIKCDLYRNNLMASRGLMADKDMRIRFFNLMYKLILNYSVVLNFHKSFFILPEHINRITATPDDGTAHEISNDYITFNNNGLMYQTTSFVELFFRSVLKTINGKYFIGQFWEAKKNVFEITEMSKETNFWNSLSVLFNFRNGIHNNGIYAANEKNSSLRMHYRERTFVFEHGFPMFGLDTDALFDILNDIVDGTYLLVQQQAIQNIPVIEDIGGLKF